MHATARPVHGHGRRHPVLLACLAALALGAAAWSPPAAHALDVTTCTGTQTNTFSPGELLLTTRTIHVTYSSTRSCTSTDPTITGSTVSGSRTSDLSCTSVARLEIGTPGQIHWNTGETSYTTVTEHSNSVVAGQSVETNVASIDSGKFAGAEAVTVITNIAPDLLACLAEPGLTSRQGLVTSTITG